MTKGKHEILICEMIPIPALLKSVHIYDDLQIMM